ncbi:MAG: oligosaccharide flippase family protein [Desulfobacterales bacterium]|nr:oligosaccharide flippase family protein [Desulfobacterales bacterium]
MNYINSNLVNRWLTDFKSAISKGFLYIVLSGVLNKGILFFYSFILIRVLSKESFGSLTYAQNILNLALLLQGFGVGVGILQYCSLAKTENDRYSYMRYGLKIGFNFNIIISALTILIAVYIPLPVPLSNEYLLYLSLFPLLSVIVEAFISYIRACLKNKMYSILTVSNSVLLLISAVIGSKLFDVKGVIIGRYVAYALSILLVCYLLISEVKFFWGEINLTYKNRMSFLKFSVTSMLTNSMSSILYLLDTLIIGIVFKEASIIANYKVATIIPFNLSFIPSTVMMFMYPYFAKNISNKNWIRKNSIKIVEYFAVLNFMLCFFLFVFAESILTILFGQQYSSSSDIFRVLVIGFFIAGTFRVPSGNILASIGKIKVNFINSIISGVVNILLDIVLIYIYGAIGAAFATALTFFISSFISTTYLFYYLKK